MDTGTIRRVRWVIAALASTTACAFVAWAILLAAPAFFGRNPLWPQYVLCNLARRHWRKLAQS